ncbi:MAG TPA: winged helix-turn-helix domain-containing protein [Solirubrobacterales bacterium]
MPPEQSTAAVDPRLIRALGHPLRQRILHALGEEVASPSELSRKLGARLGNVSYHVKILFECQAIELVKTAPVRGAVEHFYRATIRPYFTDGHWSDMPLTTRRALFDDNLQEIWSHLVAAACSGGLDDEQCHISWVGMELDQQAYDEMTEQLKLTLERAIDLQAEAAARLAKLSPEERDSHRTELAIMHFHRAADAPAAQVASPQSGRSVSPV